MANSAGRIAALEARKGGSETRFYPYFRWQAACVVAQLHGQGIAPEPKKPRGYDDWYKKLPLMIASDGMANVDELAALVRGSMRRDGVETALGAIDAVIETPATAQEPEAPALAVDRLQPYRDAGNERPDLVGS
jgi:hypothetical protein